MESIKEAVDESVNDDLSEDTSDVLGGTADNIIDAMNNSDLLSSPDSFL